ncbi:hypothetical protein B0T19DRAFT_127904 [Cercophora scortea]|uniref:Secreted protein n=1 Tax=Cercophora scortea TaxID=314031 RepID=A0AAE0IYF8_9PEZI|nr:hypothetical protein B0T19DRAFT_127904 [Cercophora scortea]
MDGELACGRNPWYTLLLLGFLLLTRYGRSHCLTLIPTPNQPTSKPSSQADRRHRSVRAFFHHSSCSVRSLFFQVSNHTVVGGRAGVQMFMFTTSKASIDIHGPTSAVSARRMDLSVPSSLHTLGSLWSSPASFLSFLPWVSAAPKALNMQPSPKCTFRQRPL